MAADELQDLRHYQMLTREERMFAEWQHSIGPRFRRAMNILKRTGTEIDPERDQIKIARNDDEFQCMTELFHISISQNEFTTTFQPAPDGWFHIAPHGTFPHPTGALQVIDAEACEAMLRDV